MEITQRKKVFIRKLALPLSKPSRELLPQTFLPYSVKEISRKEVRLLSMLWVFGYRIKMELAFNSFPRKGCFGKALGNWYFVSECFGFLFTQSNF